MLELTDVCNFLEDFVFKGSTFVRVHWCSLRDLPFPVCFCVLCLLSPISQFFPHTCSWWPHDLLYKEAAGSQSSLHRCMKTVSESWCQLLLCFGTYCEEYFWPACPCAQVSLEITSQWCSRLEWGFWERTGCLFWLCWSLGETGPSQLQWPFLNMFHSPYINALWFGTLHLSPSLT